MRFITKAEEFELLKADVLQKLTEYQHALQNANYENLNDPFLAAPMVRTYSYLVASNAALRTFLNTEKLYLMLSKKIT